MSSVDESEILQNRYFHYFYFNHICTQQIIQCFISRLTSLFRFCTDLLTVCTISKLMPFSTLVLDINQKYMLLTYKIPCLLAVLKLPYGDH